MKKFSEDKDSIKKKDLKLKAVGSEGIDVVQQVELEGEDIPAPLVVPTKRFGNDKSRRDSREPRDARESEFIEKVVSINRITKVTKGGKKLSFSALVVVGDGKGKIGYSLDKAAEVSIAIRKAMSIAKRNMITIPLKGTTIPHEIIGECGAAKVLLKPAVDGTGVIASGPVRAICDGLGIRNILTKCHRSNNPINVVKATMDGLSRLKPARIIGLVLPEPTLPLKV